MLRGRGQKKRELMALIAFEVFLIVIIVAALCSDDPAASVLPPGLAMMGLTVMGVVFWL